MAIVLKLKKGESVERGLKRMKKILDKEGLLKTIRDQRYFEKPCVKARKKSQRARIRNRSRRGRMELNCVISWFTSKNALFRARFFLSLIVNGRCFWYNTSNFLMVL